MSLILCTAIVNRDKIDSACHRLATKDQVERVFTKCETHCKEATTRRNQKREARYAAEKAADDKRWAMEDAREELVVLVRDLLEDADIHLPKLWADRLRGLVERATP